MATLPPPSLLKSLQAVTPSSSESDIGHKLIIPLLNSLGYSDGDWKTQASVGKTKLDFLVHPQQVPSSYFPYLVIEIKSANKSINHNIWQINAYMRQSGAVLGLLTNGYSFHLLYNIEGEITKIAEYSQPTFITHFSLFHKLLCKDTCLVFFDVLLKNQQHVNLRFFATVAKAFANETMFEIFRRKQNTSSSQPTATSSAIASKGEKKPMIITVFNNKGGVGKTTLTINLAAALTRLEKRVLLIDIDAQANLSTGLGIDPLNDVETVGKKDVTHLLVEPRTKLEDVIFRKTWKDIDIDIVPSHIRLSRMESRLIQMVDSDRVLAKKLKQNNYDFIFIDPPPSFGKVNSISLMASSGILIPIQLSPYPIRALEYVMEQAHEIESFKDEPLPILGIAVSMYDQKSKSFNASMIESVNKILAKNITDRTVDLFPEHTWIPRLNIVSKCPDQGYPIHQAEFDETLSQQDREAAQKVVDRYQNLAQHLIKISEGDLSK